MDKKRILILTDSLGLPRTEPQLVKYEETYISLLRKDGYDVVNLSIGGGLISDLVWQYGYYLPFSPDIVLVQSGIVDCAPRALRRCELGILRKLNLIKFLNKKLLYFLRKYRSITYTSKKLYKSQLEFLLSKFPNSKFIFLGILKPIEEYEKIVPGIRKNIIEYNNILKNLQSTTYIDMMTFPSDGIQPDCHHLNVKGHYETYQRIKSVLENM